MKITAVDDKNDLFFIEDILPIELLEKINKIDLMQTPWESQRMQVDWNRRRLLPADLSPLAQVDWHYLQVLDQIEQATNVEFTHKTCWSSFWLDHDGFDCAIHEDGAERGYTPSIAMQIYLTESDYKLGTVWYFDAAGDKVRYSFPYKRNTGYLMLNHPGQWHGMTNKIPADQLRLSSYTYFGEFSHK